MQVLSTTANRLHGTFASLRRSKPVACQAHPIDLTEKSTPVNRAVLGGFGLAARATRVPWHNRAETQTLVPQLQKHMQEVTNPKLSKLSDYPAYLYDNTMHGYPHGNFHANSSLDAESAVSIFNGMIMGQPLDPMGANHRWRQATTAQTAAFYAESHAASPAQVLDLCCGTGASSDYLRRIYPKAEIIGLDASPVHLAEALRTGPADVLWMHALAESSHIADASQDLVTWTFTTHETPAPVALQIIAEAERVLRPDGVFAITDVPQLRQSWGLFGSLYTLLQHLGIEPHLAGYRTANFCQLLGDAGFAGVRATEPGVPCMQVMGRKL